jgi:hypothetical protein
MLFFGNNQEEVWYSIARRALRIVERLVDNYNLPRRGLRKNIEIVYPLRGIDHSVHDSSTILKPPRGIAIFQHFFKGMIPQIFINLFL